MIFIVARNFSYIPSTCRHLSLGVMAPSAALVLSLSTRMLKNVRAIFHSSYATKFVPTVCLGLTFGGALLKNIYPLIFFGNLTPSGKGDPYVQLLSVCVSSQLDPYGPLTSLQVTERDKAISEFPGLNANRLLRLDVLRGISQIVHSSAEPQKQPKAP